MASFIRPSYVTVKVANENARISGDFIERAGVGPKVKRPGPGLQIEVRVRELGKSVPGVTVQTYVRKNEDTGELENVLNVFDASGTNNIYQLVTLLD